VKTVTPFSNNLRRLREERGLTQGRVGDIVGVNWVTVSRWERSETEPSFAMLEKLAQLLGVTVADLFATNGGS